MSKKENSELTNFDYEENIPIKKEIKQEIKSELLDEAEKVHDDVMKRASDISKIYFDHIAIKKSDTNLIPIRLCPV